MAFYNCLQSNIWCGQGQTLETYHIFPICHCHERLRFTPESEAGKLTELWQDSQCCNKASIVFWQLLQVQSKGEEGLPSAGDQHLVDRVSQWELKAAQQYREDGTTDGWDSDTSEPETAEQKYIRASPLPQRSEAMVKPS